MRFLKKGAGQLFGLSVVVNSENPTDWTTAIKKILGKDRKSRLEEVETLRDSYDKKYNWAKQISRYEFRRFFFVVF